VPYQLARTLATVDVVGGGRVMMAVGVGWLREEFDILGIDWKTRGARTDEAMAVLRTLWRDPHPEFHGEHFDLPPVTFQPKPVHAGGPRLYVAGLSKPAFRRAARHGDGWYGHDLPVHEAASVIKQIEAAREEHGTAERPFEYTTRAPWDISPAQLESFRACGVHRLVLDVGSAAVHGLGTVVSRVERIGRDLVRST
jgi:alkanesulfonate monooxygenase SsuD/methylene tetrahydromethanopterin reductase-like flavin-dependent oxidoreductase (luciferase family)